MKSIYSSIVHTHGKQQLSIPRNIYFDAKPGEYVLLNPDVCRICFGSGYKPVPPGVRYIASSPCPHCHRGYNFKLCKVTVVNPDDVWLYVFGHISPKFFELEEEIKQTLQSSRQSMLAWSMFR